jgi:hypothetical protein
MEDEMRSSRSISAKAALACGFLLTALALAAPSSAAEARNLAPVSHHHLALHHRSVDPRAAAQVPAAPAFFPFGWSGSYVPAPRKPETDGLSRNPDDCVKYGCIDNGGG